jgi:hypothetical protein
MGVWESRKFATCLAVLITFFSLLGGVAVYAQVSGATLSGTVTDASGSAVANATVSIRNTATGIVREVTTDSAGFYSAPNLSPATYDVTTSAAGFSKLVETGITLTVGLQQALNISLKVGQVSESVTVTSEAPQVELTSSAITAEVNETTVRELPLNGRDWSSLAVLEPGVIGIRSQLGTTGSVNRGNRGFGNQLATDGHRPSENTYRVNGINVNDYSNGSPGSVEGKQLGVDGIQEFSVVTTNYTAEYGRTSGAVINAVLKTGSNGFHGDAYWFLRDEGLDAKNFFDNVGPIPPFHRNQFGASVGGPIIKNKTFFFVDYEGVRQTRSGTAKDFVPSVAARSGLLCSLCTTQQQLPNNPSDPNGTTNGVDNVVAKYLPLYPQPNPALGTDPTGDIGEVVTNPLQIYTENYVTARVDHKFSEKDSLDGFYFYDKSPQVTPDNFLLSTAQTVSSRQMVGLEETHIFSTALVNTFRAGYNRSVGLVGQPGTALQSIAADTTLGVGTGRNTPIIQINGVETISLMQGGLGSQAMYNHILNSFQYNDDAFLTRGTHSIRFGGFVERLQGHEFTIQRPNGSFVFDNLTAFLTNNPHSLNSIGSAAVGRPYGDRTTFIGGYVQDDWKIRPSLTLNLGIRYEIATLPTEIHNNLSVIENVFGGPRVSVTHPWQNLRARGLWDLRYPARHLDRSKSGDRILPVRSDTQQYWCAAGLLVCGSCSHYDRCQQSEPRTLRYSQRAGLGSRPKPEEKLRHELERQLPAPTHFERDGYGRLRGHAYRAFAFYYRSKQHGPSDYRNKLLAGDTRDNRRPQCWRSQADLLDGEFALQRGPGANHGQDEPRVAGFRQLYVWEMLRRHVERPHRRPVPEFFHNYDVVSAGQQGRPV